MTRTRLIIGAKDKSIVARTLRRVRKGKLKISEVNIIDSRAVWIAETSCIVWVMESITLAISGAQRIES